MLLVEHRSTRMKSVRREEDDAATAAISMGGGGGTSSVGISPRPHQGRSPNERTENFISGSKSAFWLQGDQTNGRGE